MDIETLRDLCSRTRMKLSGDCMFELSTVQEINDLADEAMIAALRFETEILEKDNKR